MKNKVLSHIINASNQGKKLFALLIDPDKTDHQSLDKIVLESEKSAVDLFFVGGSLMTTTKFDQTIEYLRKISSIPIVLFPGSIYQIHPKADAILLLSLISGRNADLLIGKHVEAAPRLIQSGLEVISTGYMHIDGGHPTTVGYISNTQPIPRQKPEIAACTALAGSLLGMKLIFMDAGSGAKEIISSEMIKKVKHAINDILIVGGGIRTAEQAFDVARSGADIVVVGNSLEYHPERISSIARAVHQAGASSVNQL